VAMTVSMLMVVAVSMLGAMLVVVAAFMLGAMLVVVAAFMLEAMLVVVAAFMLGAMLVVVAAFMLEAMLVVVAASTLGAILLTVRVPLMGMLVPLMTPLDLGVAAVAILCSHVLSLSPLLCGLILARLPIYSILFDRVTVTLHAEPGGHGCLEEAVVQFGLGPCDVTSQQQFWEEFRRGVLHVLHN
jgi:hypothetical protein